MRKSKNVVTNRTMILGAGMTGLAAGLASGFPIIEASDFPGGICASYYVPPQGNDRLHQAPKDGEAYRFEIGGGHWIWGGDPLVIRLIESLTPTKTYLRKAGVYFAEKAKVVPYPIQYNLHGLGNALAQKALSEIIDGSSYRGRIETMADWYRVNFGDVLCDLFFNPFHEAYTAGLWKEIVPQDGAKNPVDLEMVIRGSFDVVSSAGYNFSFIYPRDGLNALAQRLASYCTITYEKRIVRIDLKTKTIIFADGSEQRFEKVLSTIALNKMVELCGLRLSTDHDRYTSVLVVNIGAEKGGNCPHHHWLYVPRCKSGFHRVGFYSNVEKEFLPRSSRLADGRVSLYVERAYMGGMQPTNEEMEMFSRAVVEELSEWGWIRKPDVVDLTWVDVAYTWRRPGSTWREQALRELEVHGIFQIGRYGRWVEDLKEQGIAESIKEGLAAGASLKVG